MLKAGIGASVDSARDGYGLADGSTVMYGHIARPTNANSIQSAYWSNIKLKPDCSIDTAYGNNGINFMSVSNPSYQVEKLEVVNRLPDGSAYLFGESTQPITYLDGTTSYKSGAVTVAKVLASGAADTAFGVKSTFVYSRAPTAANPFPDDMSVWDARVLPSGKLLVITLSGGPYFPFAILRFNADGSPDTTFGAGGRFVVANVKADEISSRFQLEAVRSIDVQADGKLLVAGATTGLGNAPTYYPAVVRFNTDFSVDTSYGDNGVTGLREGSSDERSIVRVLPDGKALLFGTGYVSSGASGAKGFRALTVTRLLSNGQIDLTFGTAGVTRIDTDAGKFGPDNSNDVTLRAATILPDGKIVMAGDTYNLDAADSSPAKKRHIGVVRLLPNGLPDPAFANGGVYSGLETANAADEVLKSVRVTPDGKLVVTATRTLPQSDSDWVLYRFTN